MSGCAGVQSGPPKAEHVRTRVLDVAESAPTSRSWPTPLHRLLRPGRRGLSAVESLAEVACEKAFDLAELAIDAARPHAEIAAEVAKARAEQAALAGVARHGVREAA